MEDFIVPSVREASRGHVYLILTMRAVLALRVVRVLHLTKRFESMKVSGLSSPTVRCCECSPMFSIHEDVI